MKVTPDDYGRRCQFDHFCKLVLYLSLIHIFIEYNARFGDPETQAVLSRLDTDLFDIFNAVIDEKLEDIDIKWACLLYTSRCV